MRALVSWVPLWSLLIAWTRASSSTSTSISWRPISLTNLRPSLNPQASTIKLLDDPIFTGYRLGRGKFSLENPVISHILETPKHVGEGHVSLGKIVKPLFLLAISFDPHGRWQYQGILKQVAMPIMPPTLLGETALPKQVFHRFFNLTTPRTIFNARHAPPKSFGIG